MAKNGICYAEERAKYKWNIPRGCMHHMQPSSREGSDEEFNLFPWNVNSHGAWHRLFLDLKVREVWPLLEDCWLLIWDSSHEEMAAIWLTVYRYAFKKATQKEIQKVRPVRHWQAWWLQAFGGDSLDRARCLMRSMMLCMSFGHHALNDDIFDEKKLRELLEILPETGDRAWAFRTCFGKPPRAVSYDSIKKHIRKIRICTARARQ